MQTAESGSVRSRQGNQSNTSSATAELIRPLLPGHQPVQDNFAGQPKQTEPMTVPQAKSHHKASEINSCDQEWTSVSGPRVLTGLFYG